MVLQLSFLGFFSFRPSVTRILNTGAEDYRGVTYSRLNTGTDMPSKKRFRARPFWACSE